MVKMTIDQLIWSPIFLIIFFGFMEAWENKIESFRSTLEQKLGPTYRMFLEFYPVSSLISNRLENMDSCCLRELRRHTTAFTTVIHQRSERTFTTMPKRWELCSLQVGWITILSTIQSK